jgi:hypothetical protein
MPTDKAATSGWVIQVTASNATEVPAFAFFNVAVGDADKAVEAVRKRVGAVEGDRVYAVRPLSAGELEAADLKTGQLNPA